MRTAFACNRQAFVAGLAGAAVAGPLRAAEGLPKVTVTKDPSCGCCSGWVDHLKQAGLPVAVVETAEINRVKTHLGVPKALAARHTGEVAGHVIEGHVPAPAVGRLLVGKPQAAGLAVLGMLVGSPGMEVEGMEPDTTTWSCLGHRAIGSAHLRTLSGRPEGLTNSRPALATRVNRYGFLQRRRASSPLRQFRHSCGSSRVPAAPGRAAGGRPIPLPHWALAQPDIGPSDLHLIHERRVMSPGDKTGMSRFGQFREREQSQLCRP